MARLERVTGEGFKSIPEMDPELPPLNVLIGPNGAGKSNLLSFFRMLSALVQQRLQLFVALGGGANAILHHGRKRTPRIEAEVFYNTTDGKSAYSISLAGSDANDLIFVR